MCMRTKPIKRTPTGAYIIGGVEHKVHPKILRAQQENEMRRVRREIRKMGLDPDEVEIHTFERVEG